MEFPKAESEGRIGGQKPARIAGGLVRRSIAAPSARAVLGSKSPRMPMFGHDVHFSLSTHMRRLPATFSPAGATPLPPAADQLNGPWRCIRLDPDCFRPRRAPNTAGNVCLGAERLRWPMRTPVRHSCAAWRWPPSCSAKLSQGRRPRNPVKGSGPRHFRRGVSAALGPVLRETSSVERCSSSAFRYALALPRSSPAKA